MGRIPKVQRSAEEKFAIVMEGLKSGKVSETCRKHEIGTTLFYRWKDEMEKGALAALGIGGEAIADEKPLSFQEVLTDEYRALRPDCQLILIDFHRIEGKSSDWVLGHVRAGQEVFTQEVVTVHKLKLSREAAAHGVAMDARGGAGRQRHRRGEVPRTRPHSLLDSMV